MKDLKTPDSGKDMNDKNMHQSDGVSIVKYIDERLKAICTEMDSDTKVRDLQFLNVAKQFENIADSIRELRDFMSKQQGKASWSSVLFSGAISLAALLMALVALFLKH